MFYRYFASIITSMIAGVIITACTSSGENPSDQKHSKQNALASQEESNASSAAQDSGRRFPELDPETGLFKGIEVEDGYRKLKDPIQSESLKLARYGSEELPSNLDQILRDAAQEYLAWNRVDDQRPHWAPFDCSLPSSGKGRISEAEGSKNHAQKLYYLYASNRAQYLRVGWEKAKEINQPIGQILVKDSFKPEKSKAPDIDPAKGPYEEFLKGHKKSKHTTPWWQYARQGEDYYKPGERYGLFMMLKFDPEMPGTDQGWLYATLSADGTEVTSSGRVESCMGCHEEAEQDRVFGIKRQSNYKFK